MPLLANWDAPPGISALTTLRYPGVSNPPFNENNFGLHVGDDESSVYQNRQALIETLKLPSQPQWLEQTHSTTCVVVEDECNREADAAITRSLDHVLVVMTADCLPITLCNKQGTEIAVIHAGWRGLLNGIVENTLKKLISPYNNIMAWIGPGICGHCFEVGHDVFDLFCTQYDFSSRFFIPSKNNNDKYYADLAGIAKQLLLSVGISQVSLSNCCTFEQENMLYSYRRQPQTGRMATLIWFNKNRKN